MHLLKSKCPSTIFKGKNNGFAQNWKCTPHQAIQVVEEFVYSLEHIWRNVALAIRMTVSQIANKNFTIIQK